MMLKYRGRVVTEADIAFIRTLIEQHPTASRRRLSQLLCEAWNWVQPNGALRDMVCRGLLLQLHRTAQIELPAKRQSPPNPLSHRNAPRLLQEVDRTPLHGSLSEVQPLRWAQVRRTAEEALFNGLIEQYHYLRYTQPVGEHLKYLVCAADGRPLAALAWSSAPRHLGSRDRFIGWPAEVRRRRIHLIAYNPRFLILPWVRVKYLASHLLGHMARCLSQQWQAHYGHPIYLVETFVDPERYRGTCYRAAGWQCVGRTTGRGKDDRTGKANRSIKEVWCYPLCRQFRQRLLGESE
jgi:hypothetical protein